MDAHRKGCRYIVHSEKQIEALVAGLQKVSAAIELNKSAQTKSTITANSIKDVVWLCR